MIPRCVATDVASTIHATIASAVFACGPSDAFVRAMSSSLVEFFDPFLQCRDLALLRRNRWRRLRRLRLLRRQLPFLAASDHLISILGRAFEQTPYGGRVVEAAPLAMFRVGPPLLDSGIEAHDVESVLPPSTAAPWSLASTAPSRRKGASFTPIGATDRRACCLSTPTSRRSSKSTLTSRHSRGSSAVWSRGKSSRSKRFTGFR